MDQTRGKLTPAKIICEAINKEVACMFNPHEYTLTKTNQWRNKPKKGNNSPKATFSQGGAQILKLQLHFDSLEKGTDIRKVTDPLWEMMMVVERDRNPSSGKSQPPEVAFQWGRLHFRAVITNMTQKFTLFTKDGMPVRCTVNITLKQFEDVDDYRQFTPPAASGRANTQEVTATQDERVDNMVADRSNDADLAGAIRDAMERNNIDNPLNIAPGSVLDI